LSLYFGWFILECAIQAPSILEEEISHLDDLKFAGWNNRNAAKKNQIKIGKFAKNQVKQKE
jgi:hypothetical protein